LERVTDEKLTHMLSIQKSPIDKIGLEYVAPPFHIPSTFKTVFVKPCDNPFIFLFFLYETQMSHRNGTTICRSANIGTCPITCT